MIQTYEAAEILGITLDRVHTEIRAGRLRSVRVGRRLLVDKAEVLRLKARLAETVNLTEAARMLGISYHMIRKAITAGEIPYEKDGRRYWIRRDDLPAMKDEVKG